MDKDTTKHWHSRVDEIMAEIYDVIVEGGRDGDDSEWERGWAEGADYGWLKLYALKSEMQRVVDESDQ